MGISGAYQVTKPQLETVNLVCLVKKHTHASRQDKCDSSPEDAEGIMSAIADFDNAPEQAGTGTTKAISRNNVQDYLLAAADRRCAVYKHYITNAQSGTNVGFGVLTTLLGSAAGLVTGATAARALGVSAGASSGVNAEVQNAYFRNQTVSFIFSGINQKLVEVHKEIAGKQQCGVERYSIAHAIKDAIRYNATCSLSEGLDKVQDALRLGGKIGLDQVKTVLAAAKELENPETRQRKIRTLVGQLQEPTIIVALGLQKTAEQTALQQAQAIKAGLKALVESPAQEDWEKARARVQEIVLKAAAVPQATTTTTTTTTTTPSATPVTTATSQPQTTVDRQVTTNTSSGGCPL